MNKIIIQFGLLVFFLAVIFFIQKGFPLEDVLIRSFIIFIVITLLLGLLSLLFIRAINKTSYDKIDK